MVSFITLSGSLFITLSAKSLLHYRGGCLLHYRLNLLHYREVLHYRLIFITLSGSITLSGVYYIIGCNNHITPVMRSLHWLPVSSRIIFKILLLVYKSLHGLAPAYLTYTELIKPVPLSLIYGQG